MQYFYLGRFKNFRLMMMMISIRDRLHATNYQGAICCFDLTISAREEARGSAVTSNSLSVNSPACPRNVFLQIIRSPQIGMSCPRNDESANRLVRELGSPRIVYPRTGMSAKSPVILYLTIMSTAYVRVVISTSTRLPT